ncbi:hypothetical protein HY212_07535 [Candidatus Pacearchaeota archaeon]|nr:hypothetical protein [Candidatus Pacearchaeota archaeon]
MPITLDTSLNQDSIAFVEIVSQLHADYFAKEYQKFEVRDVSQSPSGGEVIYANDLWRGIRLSVYAEDSSKGSVVLIIDGMRYVSGMIFYSGEVDSLFLKTCRLIHSGKGYNSSDIEVFNAYWSGSVAYRAGSNDTIPFDENFNFKAKPSKMGTFTPDERTRISLKHLVKPLIERSKGAINGNRNFSQPGTQGKRHR